MSNLNEKGLLIDPVNVENKFKNTKNGKFKSDDRTHDADKKKRSKKKKAACSIKKQMFN